MRGNMAEKDDMAKAVDMEVTEDKTKSGDVDEKTTSTAKDKDLLTFEGYI